MVSPIYPFPVLEWRLWSIPSLFWNGVSDLSLHRFRMVGTGLSSPRFFFQYKCKYCTVCCSTVCTSCSALVQYTLFWHTSCAPLEQCASTTNNLHFSGRIRYKRFMLHLYSILLCFGMHILYFPCLYNVLAIPMACISMAVLVIAI